MEFGTDVSFFQSTQCPPHGDKVNWAQLFNLGFRFFYAKAADGVTADTSHEEHWSNATSVGFAGGSYQFGHPSMDPIACASFFFHIIRPKLVDGSLRPVIDMESLNKDKTIPLNAGQWTLTWCKTFEALSGIKPVVYASTTYMKAMLQQCPELAQYLVLEEDFWDAEYHYSGTFTSPPKELPFVAWQYAGNVKHPAFTNTMADLDMVPDGKYEKLQIKRAA